MKRYLYNYKQIFLLCGLFFFIYACNTTGTKDYSTMSNNKLLEKGDAAIEFIANTYDGKNISLSKLQKAGPVVLIFIRGFS
jgi:hypothetical protein